MTRIELKQAKPTEEDFERVINFMSTLDAYFSGYLDDEDTMDMQRLCTMWNAVECHWSRVVYGGEMCVKAICDPSSDVVELAPWLAERERHFLQAHDDCEVN